MVSLEDVKGRMYQKVWGERSLTVGEIIAFLIAIAIFWFKPFGKWSIWIAFITLFVGMAFF